MEDYPRTILELEQRLGTEEACRQYLMRLRWPDGFVCPRCQGRGGWPASRGRMVCSSCRHQARQPKGEHLLPRIHLVVSLLKRWLLGTHQGAIGDDHLDYYLDEFTFRFNCRKSGTRGKLFYRLLQQAVQIPPVPYSAIVGGKRRKQPPPTNSGWWSQVHT